MQGMSLGLRERRNSRRRERRWRLFRWAVSLAAIIAAGLYAYETGSRLAERETSRLHEEIAVLNQGIAALEADKTKLAEAATAADKKAKDWQQRYRREVPTGTPKNLYDLAQRKLEEGLDPERLTFVLSQVRRRDNCDEEVETKRFFVKTPLYRGANDSVGFGRNRITVTAQGSAAVDASGSPLARFDPAQPVAVHFTRLGGETSKTSGILPIHQGVVFGDSEYRFTLTAGPPGMVKVTGGRCPYP